MKSNNNEEHLHFITMLQWWHHHFVFFITMDSHDLVIFSLTSPPDTFREVLNPPLPKHFFFWCENVKKGEVQHTDIFGFFLNNILKNYTQFDLWLNKLNQSKSYIDKEDVKHDRKEFCTPNVFLYNWKKLTALCVCRHCCIWQQVQSLEQ